ncbi:hypothetical protein BVC80_8919g12 [Macleaya cordata]|uniref:Uncharacterized protein n=1 Tax=Macleaya cordata TaxID=56857 RepID=A0A200Q834_MACCD|nr:hypothetical protein BVC80_8919g12 [Macleaya cordata]
MDFAAYPRMSGRDVWPTIRAPGDQPTATGKFLQHQWQGMSVNPPASVFSQGSHPYLQGSSAGGTIFSSSRIPPGECFGGVSDSGCALSLLSNQSWGPRSQPSSSLSVNNIMNDEGAPMASQSTAPHGAVVNNFTGNTWSFKGNEAGSSSHQLHRDLGLGQVSSQPINSTQFSGELELAHQANRQYMELAHSRAYDSSTHQMHWSL